MKTVSVSKRIHVPAEVAWEIVRTGAHLERWVPAITRCELAGQGVGARRVCVIEGHELHESIETIDDVARLFQYRISKQALLPVRNIVGSIHLSACGPQETEVIWFVNFDLDDESAWMPVRDGIAAIYVAGIEGLADLARRSALPPSDRAGGEGDT